MSSGRLSSILDTCTSAATHDNMMTGAATNLVRLWQCQGKRPEAYDLLAPVYGWFAEGFDMAGLKDAEAFRIEIGG